MSTAYIHSYRIDIDEVIYPTDENPSLMLQSIDYFDDEIFELLQKKVLKSYPNTYAYTKSLAEYLILQQASGLPFGKRIFARVILFWIILNFSNRSPVDHRSHLAGTDACKFFVETSYYV